MEITKQKNGWYIIEKRTPSGMMWKKLYTTEEEALARWEGDFEAFIQRQLVSIKLNDSTKCYLLTNPRINSNPLGKPRDKYGITECNFGEICKEYLPDGLLNESGEDRYNMLMEMDDGPAFATSRIRALEWQIETYYLRNHSI